MMKNENIKFLIIAIIAVAASLPTTLLWHNVAMMKNQNAKLTKELNTHEIILRGTNAVTVIKPGFIQLETIQNNRTNMCLITGLGLQQNTGPHFASLSGTTGIHIQDPENRIELKPGAALTLENGSASVALYAIAGQNRSNNVAHMWGSGLVVNYGKRQGISLVNSQDENPKLEMWNNEGDQKVMALKDPVDAMMNRAGAPDQTNTTPQNVHQRQNTHGTNTGMGTAKSTR